MYSKIDAATILCKLYVKPHGSPASTYLKQDLTVIGFETLLASLSGETTSNLTGSAMYALYVVLACTMECVQ